MFRNVKIWTRLPHFWPKSLLLNVYVLVLCAELTCHPASMHCLLFVSNPAAELISGNVNSGFCCFLCIVLNLQRGVGAVFSEMSLHALTWGGKRQRGKIYSNEEFPFYSFQIYLLLIWFLKTKFSSSGMTELSLHNFTWTYSQFMPEINHASV